MGDAGAIGDVGQSLVDLLEDRMGDLVGRDDVALASPSLQGEGGNDWRLTLYLYDVSESGHPADGDRSVPPGAVRSPQEPLVLELQYLLTAHPAAGGTDGTQTTREQHEVLGRAMQVLRDDAIVRGSDLRGSLAGEEQLQVSIQRESLEAVMNVWNTFDTSYRPSVAYLVAPVTVESDRERPTERVVERTIEERELRSAGSDDA